MSESPRKGREPMKKDTASRVKRGLRSLTRLPKLNRARGNKSPKTLEDKRQDSKARKVKSKKKEKVRIAPPKTSPHLKEVLDGSNYGLVLGDEFNSTQNLTGPQWKKILTGLNAQVSDEETSKRVSLLLAEKLEKGVPGDSYVEAKNTIEGEVGSSKFNTLLSKAIAQELNTEGDHELDMKLLRTLDANTIVYSGIDRTLEDSFQHDNLQVVSLTPIDLLGYEPVDGSLLGGIKASSKSGAKIIIKPLGDFTKPDTVLITDEEKFRMFGLALDGTELEESEMSSEAIALKSLLAECLDADSMVLLGQSLKTTDPISYVFRNDHQNLVANAKEDEEGNKIPIELKHIALVSETKGKDKRLDSEECGIEYISYKPDTSGTQITEFMSYMTGDCKTIPENLSPNEVFEVAVGDDAFPQFLQDYSVKESTAKVVNIFTDNISDLPFLLNELRREKISTKLTEQYNEKYAATVCDAMEARRVALQNRIIPQIVTDEETKEAVEEKEVAEVEEKEVAETEEKEVVKTEEKETQVETESYETVLRVVIPTSAAERFARKGKAHAIKIASKIVDAVEDSKGRLDVRFLDDSTEENRTEHFEILYINTGATFGDFCLYHNENKPEFPVSFFEVNSNNCEEKTLLFERMWINAQSSGESMTYLADVLERAKEACAAAAEKKSKKGGIFSRGFGTKRAGSKTEKAKSKAELKATSKAELKATSKAEKADVAEAENTKADGEDVEAEVKGAEGEEEVEIKGSKVKRDGLFKRVVRTVKSINSKKDKAATPIVADLKKAADEEKEVVEEAKEEVVEEPTEEVKEETKEEVKEETKEEVKEEAKEEVVEKAKEEEPKKKGKFNLFSSKKEKKGSKKEGAVEKPKED